MHRLALVAALALLALAGCTTPTGQATATPQATAIAPPKVELPPASIRGSQESSTLLDHFTAFVSAVDGTPVAAGRAGWDQALPLPAGRRVLAVEFVRGAFQARTGIVFEAKPGAAYELRHASDAQVYGAHSYCEFWIVDLATGEKIAPPKRVALEKLSR